MSTRSVSIYKSSPVRREVPDAVHVLPDGDTLEIFSHDAKLIADALYATLPGGTMDRLLIEMLQRTASMLIVPYDALAARKAVAP